jgi:hypothetical protein
MTQKKASSDQLDRFREAARALECDDDEARFDAKLKKVAKARPDAKVCPECGHTFKGNGWDGIDAHWKSRHEAVMPYEEAWPLLKAETYKA